jgi:hypothetical protein
VSCPNAPNPCHKIEATRSSRVLGRVAGRRVDAMAKKGFRAREVKKKRFGIVHPHQRMVDEKHLVELARVPPPHPERDEVPRPLPCCNLLREIVVENRNTGTCLRLGAIVR